MNSKGKEYADAIEREVENWPGVAVTIIDGGKHPKAKFEFDGKFKSHPFAGSGSDSAFGIHTMLGDMRRCMKQLGASRDKPEPSREDDEANYHKPNNGRTKRPDPVKTEPADPKPDIADQLVEAGIVTEGKRLIESIEKLTETYSKRAAVESARAPAKVISIPSDDQTDAEARHEAAIEEFRNRVEAVVDGIYFDLDDRVYHAVRALGSSSLCDLLVSAATFWRGSWLDPNAPELDDEQTKAQMIGKAYHTARLEPDRFEKLYARKPSKQDFPTQGLLTSDAAVKAELKKLGQTQALSGEDPEERFERLLDAGYEFTILPLELARFNRELAGRQALDGDIWDEIKTDMERIESQPQVIEHLRGGFSEVSVIWTDENGLRLKARFDHLKVGEWSDLKTFVNSSRKPVLQAMNDAFRYNRYYVQAAHYRDGYDRIQSGGLAVIGEAAQAQRDLVDAIAATEVAPKCWYVFQEKGGVPNLYARQFMFNSLDHYREYEIKAMLDDPERQALVRDALASKTAIFRRGQIEIARAKAIFSTYASVYAHGEPWAPVDPVGRIEDADFNRFWLEEG